MITDKVVPRDYRRIFHIRPDVKLVRLDSRSDLIVIRTLTPTLRKCV